MLYFINGNLLNNFLTTFTNNSFFFIILIDSLNLNLQLFRFFFQYISYCSGRFINDVFIWSVEEETGKTLSYRAGITEEFLKFVCLYF